MIDSDHFTELIAADQLGLLEDSWLQTDTICRTIANVHGSKPHVGFTIPGFKERRERPPMSGLEVLAACKQQWGRKRPKKSA